MDDEQSQGKHLTPYEIARIEREERERLEGWINEGLDAFDRIMNKPLGTMRVAGKTYTRKGI